MSDFSVLTTESGDFVEFDTGTEVSFASKDGQTFILTGDYRPIVYADGSCWYMGLTPCIKFPLISPISSGVATGEYRFSVRPYRTRGEVRGNPSPLGRALNGNTYIQVNNTAIEITRPDDLDPNADGWEVLAHEAQDTNWRVVGRADSDTKRWTFDLDAYALQAMPFAFAPGGLLANAQPVPLKRAIDKYGFLIGSCGGDVSLSSVSVINRPYPRPFPDGRLGNVSRGTVLLDPNGTKRWNGSEYGKFFFMIDADSHQVSDIYAVDHVIDDRTLRLNRSFNNMDLQSIVNIGSITRSDDVYYDQSFPFTQLVAIGASSVITIFDASHLKVGMYVDSDDLPADTYIAAINSATEIELSAGVTSDGSHDFTIDLSRQRVTGTIAEGSNQITGLSIHTNQMEVGQRIFYSGIGQYLEIIEIVSASAVRVDKDFTSSGNVTMALVLPFYRFFLNDTPLIAQVDGDIFGDEIRNVSDVSNIYVGCRIIPLEDMPDGIVDGIINVTGIDGDTLTLDGDFLSSDHNLNVFPGAGSKVSVLDADGNAPDESAKELTVVHAFTDSPWIAVRGNTPSAYLNLDTDGRYSDAGYEIEAGRGYSFYIQSGDSLPNDNSLLGMTVELTNDEGGFARRSITYHTDSKVNINQSLKDYEGYTDFKIIETTDEHEGACQVSLGMFGSEGVGTLIYLSRGHERLPIDEDSLVGYEITLWDSRDTTPNKVTKEISVDRGWPPDSSINKGRTLIVYGWDDWGGATGSNTVYNMWSLVGPEGVAETYEGKLFWDQDRDIDLSSPDKFFETALKAFHYSSAALHAPSGMFFSRLDVVGRNNEATPTTNWLNPPELKGNEIMAFVESGSVLLVFTRNNLLVATGASSIPQPLINWQDVYNVGLIAPEAYSEITENVGVLRNGDVLFASITGLYRYTSGGIINLMESMGCQELWRRIDVDSLEGAVAAWDSNHNRFILANLALDDETESHSALIYDAGANAVYLESHMPRESIVEIVTDANERFVVSGCDKGFLYVDAREDAAARDSLTDTERRDDNATDPTYYSGTIDALTVNAMARVAEDTAFPTTDQFTGAFVWLRNSTSGDYVGRRIASNTSDEITFETDLDSVVGWDEYYVGAIPFSYTTKILDASQFDLKQLVGMVAGIAGPSSGSWKIRLSFWEAGHERDLDDLGDPNATIHVTKSMVDAGRILLPGLVSQSFALRMDGLVLGEDWDLSRIDMIVREIRGAW